MNKKCSKCGLEKPLMEFYKDIHNKDGHRSDCKSCHTPVVRQYQATGHGQRVALQSERKRTGTIKRKLSHNRASARYKRTARGKIVENASSHRRRERQQNVDAMFSIDNAIAVYARFNYQCFVCSSRNKLSIDHHRPLVRGYALTEENAVLLCVSCNSRKGIKMPEEFYSKEQLEFLNGQGVV